VRFFKCLTVGFLMSAGLVSNAFAVDSYNPSTNELTIPLVYVGGTAYSSVVINVGAVVGIKGGLPSADADTYDASSNQLTIPSVTVGGSTFTNVTITVQKIISVQGRNAVSSEGSATATPSGTICSEVSDADVFGAMMFETSQPIRAKPWGCLIVSATNNQPVFDGQRSARFEVRLGDCSASSSWDDCTNDRSRHEINETGISATQGQVITWEERVYVPSQARFRPNGGNIMFLTQINYRDNFNYGSLASLEVADNGDFLIRTHTGFNSTILAKVPAAQNPFNRWVPMKFEVKSTTASDGYIKVWADGKLVVNQTRATLPTATAVNWLKVGIYNAFLSQAREPYDTQVVYFDSFKKTIQ
jgi:hypothetical protein